MKKKNLQFSLFCLALTVLLLFLLAATGCSMTATYLEITGFYSLQTDYVNMGARFPAIPDDVQAEAAKINDRYFYEDDNYAYYMESGFAYNWYDAYAVGSLAAALGESGAVAALKPQIEYAYESYDAAEASLTDVYSYLYACNAVQLTPPADTLAALKERLRAQTREDAGIPYSASAAEPLTFSLLMTCRLQEFADWLGLEDLQWAEKVETLAENAEFIPYGQAAQTTFYNAGGYYVYALDVFGLWSEEWQAKTADWFRGWQEYYESMALSSASDIIQYADYADILQLYGDTAAARQKLQSAFLSVSAEEWQNVGAGNLVAGPLQYVDTAAAGNAETLSGLRAYANEQAEAFTSKSGTPSLKNTYGGLLNSYSAQNRIPSEIANKAVRFLLDIVFPAANQSDDPAEAAELIANGCATLAVINSRAEANFYVYTVSSQTLERIFDSLDDLPDEEYLPTVNHLFDVYAYASTDHILPYSSERIEKRVREMADSGTLTLQDACLAMRCSRRVVSDQDTFIPTLEDAGYDLKQQKLLTAEEAFAVYDACFDETGKPREEMTIDVELMNALSSLCWSVLTDPANTSQSTPTADERKANVISANLSYLYDRLDTGGGLLAESAGGPVTPYSILLSYQYSIS